MSSRSSTMPAPEVPIEDLLRTGANLMATRDIAGATEVFLSAIAACPSSVPANIGLGIAYKASGDLEGSISFLGHALELDPNCVEARYNLGNTLLAAGRLCEAEKSLRLVLAARPTWAYPHNSLGTVLLRQGRPDEASVLFRQACALAADWFLPHYNLGLAQIQLGQDDAAVLALRSAIRHQPDLADAHLNLALLLLKHGGFEEGFREYEWRFQNAGLPAIRTGRPQQIWDGQWVKGQTLLLCAEQGAGDLIQFVRFVKLLSMGGLRVLVECPAGLKRLLATCPGVDGVISCDEPCPEADVQLPLLSLPRLLGMQVKDLPGTIPYLSSPVEDLRVMHRLVRPSQGFKVGIAWTGDPHNPRNPERSITPSDFAPLARIQGIHVFSLQYQDGGVSSGQLAHMKVRSLGCALGDFSSAAAAIEAMDLTITVDTSVAHLAGALGKPVWTLLHHLSDWRWMTLPSASRWYPTMRLYRQDRAGDWNTVLQRVRHDLEQIVSCARRDSRRLVSREISGAV